MQVLVRAQAPDAVAATALAQRRVSQALRRFAGAVSRAQVHLSQVRAGKGEPDKHCQVVLQTGQGPVTVSAVAADWRGALQAALAQATRFLRRLWERVKAVARQRPQPRRVAR